MTKEQIPTRYFDELLSIGHTVPRFESNGENMRFKVGKVYLIKDSKSERTVMAKCTQNCPYALKTI